ncbi:MAG: peptidyl-prolyl cis-trans isomerase [Candidatus Aminicenantes bacterium]|nr:peptidyl-prolyl cis-trans isomerase [Candidatus Aminicenantes bacterium]
MSERIYAFFLLFFFTASLFLVSAGADNPEVIMKTTKGDITIELYKDKAPITVKNFLSYVDEKFYEGTIFHRVIKDFMIQGGGLTPDFKEKPGKPPIKNEATNGLRNKRGTIAMARTQVIDSATSQFFINHVDNPFLDHKSKTPQGFGYAVFGKVIKGMDVVDAIANTKTMNRAGMADVPRETIKIISVSRIESK